MTDTLLATKTEPIIWYKDAKFLIGISLIVLSFFIGEFGKGLSIIKFYIPKYLITGLSLWAFSWILLLLGVFLVGIETLKMIKVRIHAHVKKTYHYTKGLKRKLFQKSFPDIKQKEKKFNAPQR